MEVLESARMAWRSIRAHRLRSTLTTLGVIIGVGAVITFVTLGASLQGAIVGDVAGQQSPSMTVTTGQVGGGNGPPGGGGGQSVFTEHDLQQLRAIAGVEVVVPHGRVALSGLSYRGRSVAVSSMTTTTPAYFGSVEGWNFSAGGPFRPGQREVVLNEPAATAFTRNVSTGDTVTVTRAGGESVNATVVGILGTSEGSGFGPPGRTSQPRIYGPLEPFHTTRLASPTTGESERVYSELTVVAVDFEQVEATQDRVTDYLTAASDARELLPESAEITVQTSEQMIEQIRSVLNTFTSFITGIAVISLIVGAIGIANIMLVSVTERTREIGVMKAVGFQNRDILQLFLVEAVILGLVGSVFGVAVGVLGGYLVTDLIGLPFTFPLEWAAIAVAVGLLVGVVAGLYPAWNGARVDPIDALRYE